VKVAMKTAGKTNRSSTECKEFKIHLDKRSIKDLENLIQGIKYKNYRHVNERISKLKKID